MSELLMNIMNNESLHQSIALKTDDKFDKVVVLFMCTAQDSVHNQQSYGVHPVVHQPATYGPQARSLLSHRHQVQVTVHQGQRVSILLKT